MSSLWSDLKAWFKYSEIIFWSRAQVVVGFLIAAFAAIDWTQLTTLDSKTAMLGVGLIINGLFQEYLRRRNADI